MSSEGLALSVTLVVVPLVETLVTVVFSGILGPVTNMSSKRPVVTGKVMFVEVFSVFAFVDATIGAVGILKLTSLSCCTSLITAELKVIVVLAEATVVPLGMLSPDTDALFWMQYEPVIVSVAPDETMALVGTAKGGFLPLMKVTVGPAGTLPDTA